MPFYSSKKAGSGGGGGGVYMYKIDINHTSMQVSTVAMQCNETGPRIRVKRSDRYWVSQIRGLAFIVLSSVTVASGHRTLRRAGPTARSHRCSPGFGALAWRK